jgi:hypothetical protein
MPPVEFSTGIQPRTQVIMFLVGVAMLLFVLNMVRRKQIREQYSLLWIITAVVITFSALFIRAVEKLSHLVGVYYPPAFLFLLAILLMFTLQFHVTTVISNLREQNRSLVQDLGLLANEVRELRRALEAGAGNSGPRP